MTPNQSKSFSSTDRTERRGEAWSALDTHHAAEAAGIRGLPAPITWTALHKFAEEVSCAVSKKDAINAELLEALQTLATHFHGTNADDGQCDAAFALIKRATA